MTEDILQKLKQKAEEVREYISVSEIPESLELKMVSEPTFKVDKRGNEAFFITLQTRDKKFLVQKYTPSTYNHLIKAIQECGGEEELKNEFHIWVKERVGRAINDRLFPTPLPKTSKKAK
jgi:hypothetical protein